MSGHFFGTARRDLSLSAARNNAAKAFEQFAEALQALPNTNRYPYPNTLVIDLPQDPIRKNPKVLLLDMMQRMVTTEIDRIMGAKINTEMFRDAEEVLMDLLSS